MKIQKGAAASLAAFLVMVNSFSAFAMTPQVLSQENVPLRKTASQRPTIETNIRIPENHNNAEHTKSGADKTDESNGKTEDGAEGSDKNDMNGSEDNENNDGSTENDSGDIIHSNDNSEDNSEGTENEQKPGSDELDNSASDNKLAFHPEIKDSFQGYMIEALLTDSGLNTSLVQPLYSLDGETYQDCGKAWDVVSFSPTAGTKFKFQLYSNCEPFSSYLAESLDSFYLKLHITREDGVTYETQSALIDRGVPQPMPDNLHFSAMFSPAMAVINTRPFDYYGGYQLTVSENTTAEEILSYLPNTLPIKISLETEKKPFADGIIDCPVTWKPLSLPRLTAGESITITDAAEKIIIPEGTQITTPKGIFQLDKSLPLDEPPGNNPYPLTDEVRLVLNIISEDEKPTGVLPEEKTGLEMSFHLKPTGATAIHAYTVSEGDCEWTEISSLSLTEAVNAHPSGKNSGYTLVISNRIEPYRSYLEALAAGNTPTPFFVGLKIEGGVYNGKQLTLPWPNTYELPLKLPEMGGTGGNHNNAGAGNKDDSTQSGQRPSLPQAPEYKPQATTEPNNHTSDSGNKNDTAESKPQPDISANPGNKPETTTAPDITENNSAPDTKKENTADRQYPVILPYPESMPQAAAIPEHMKNSHRRDSQNLTTKMKLPMKQNMPGMTSVYEILLNQVDGDNGQKHTPFLQLPTAAQKQADANTPGTMANTKTAASAELTPSSLHQPEGRFSDASALSNKRDNAVRQESAKRTIEGKYHKPLLSVTVMAATGLCITGIYFVTASGYITGISRLLRKLLLRK